MVQSSTVAAMYINIFLSAAALAAPFFVVYFVAGKKESGLWSSLGLGLLGQFWSQHLLLIPVMWIFTLFGWFVTIYKDNSYYLLYVLVTSVILVILAAVGRLWSIWLMNKRTPSLYRAICAGIGFGGVKVLSMIVSYISYIGYSSEINSVGIETFTGNLKKSSATLTDESIANLIDQLTNAGAYRIVMEGINMIFLVAVEVALAVVVYEGLIRRKMWIGAAVSAGINLIYTYIGTVIGALSTDRLGNVLSRDASGNIYNAYMLVCGLISIMVIKKSLDRYKLVLAEGPYAHYAYFEKKDKDSKE